MFAIIKTGGKQYKAAPGSRLVVEKLPGDAGAQVSFNDVLLIQPDNGAPIIGAPTLPNAVVNAVILQQSRAPKVLAFKKRRRKNSRRLRGHRQHRTAVTIQSISNPNTPPNNTPPNNNGS